MKAEELMIGDWVYNTHNDQPEQVYEIGSGLVMLDYNDLYEYDEIEPIPLTEDFFKANGYKYDGDAAMQGKHVTIFYGDKKHGWEVNVDRDDLEPYGKSVTVHIKYVHEFQHVLRMCGIKKKIVVR